MRTKDIVTTCRRVLAEEAVTIGLATRAVPSGVINKEVDALAADLAKRPRYAINATKSHVNAVARAMSAGDTGYADGYVQAASWLDPEVRQMAGDYVDSFRLKG